VSKSFLIVDIVCVGEGRYFEVTDIMYVGEEKYFGATDKGAFW
jgi:hypothetical protein